MGNMLGALAGLGLPVALLVVAVGVTVMALLLMIAFRMVLGYMPSYLRATVVVVAATLASALVLGVAYAFGGGSRLLSIAVQFAVGAALVHLLLLADTGVRIGYARACLVQLVYTVMEIVLGVTIAIVAVTLFGVSVASMVG